MKFEDFITTLTFYEIICAAGCSSTAEYLSIEDAVEEAKMMGFKIINNELFCSKCIDDRHTIDTIQVLD